MNTAVVDNVSVLIDGAYLQKELRKLKIFTNDVAIHQIVLSSLAKNERLHKVLYYDCRPYQEDTPEHGNKKHRNNEIINKLSQRQPYAVRLGTLKKIRTKEKPIYTQKGVDIRIALDIAKIIMARKIERIIVICGDTDLIPALKMARIHDIEVVLIKIQYITSTLLAHADFVRNINTQQLMKDNKLKKFTPKTQ